MAARTLADKTAPPDVRSVWVSDNFTGKGTYADPIDVPSGGGSGGNLDGGQPDSVYGGGTEIDGGAP